MNEPPFLKVTIIHAAKTAVTTSNKMEYSEELCDNYNKLSRKVKYFFVFTTFRQLFNNIM